MVANSEFHDPIDPSTFPLRRCAKCDGEMTAVDAGGESFSPVARYSCKTCKHQVKITPLENSGGWLAMALVAWAAIAGLIYATAKPFDGLSIFWIGMILAVFIFPFIPAVVRNKRHPIIGTGEPGLGAGFVGNLSFLIFAFAVLMTVAAAASVMV